MAATLPGTSSLPALLFAAYAFGRDRGAVTGRTEPSEEDFARLASLGFWSLDGTSDPRIGVEFEAGVYEGATLAASDEEEQAAAPARPGRPPTAEEEALALAI